MSEKKVYPKDWAEAGIDLGRITSGRAKTKCPQCQHTRSPEHRNDKPLWVNVDLCVWKCHHCDWRGCLEHKNQDQWKRDLTARKYVKPAVIPDDEQQLSSYAISWLEARGIDPEIAAELGCYTGHHFVNDEGEPKNYGPKVLTTPYKDSQGNVVHLKHRRLDKKTFWSSKDTQLVFWGLDQVDLDSDSTLFIVEGEMDALALAQAGVYNVLSVPNGTPEPKIVDGVKISPVYKMDYFEASEELIRKAERIVVATDADEPGQALADEIIRRAGGEKCWRVTWPDECKDANDVLVKHGARGLSAAMGDARPVPISGIYTGFDLEKKLLRLYIEGYDKGADFGYMLFDKIYTAKQGYLTIVTGIPGHGKSTVLDQLLVRLAHRHSWTFAIFSPEQQPLEWHQTQLIEQRVGQPFFEGHHERMSQETMLDANRWVSEHFAFILPETPTIDSILELADAQILRTGIKGMVIDPWNEIEHQRPQGLTETEYISLVLTKLRNFARNRDIALWIIAHPTKMRKEDGIYPIPDLYDISGAAHWNNKADFGMVVYRNMQEAENPVDIHIVKSRRRHYATLGRVRFKYDPATKRLNEAPLEEQGRDEE